MACQQKNLPDHDPQDTGPQYLEDLATAYWSSQALFTAVEADIFTSLDPYGKTIGEIAAKSEFPMRGLDSFLRALCKMGLLCNDGDSYFNTQLSKKYLVSGKPYCQREAILWRKELVTQWSGLSGCLKSGERADCLPENDAPSLDLRRKKYINAMDCSAKTKALEILPIFKSATLKGEMLDVGAGSGAIASAFLKEFPALKATLMDIPEVLAITEDFIKAEGLASMVDFCPADILSVWPHDGESFDLIVLSNIIHAYSEKELPHILASASECLNESGLLVIHDFFLEHYPQKAALFDLNMFINTYNGSVFSQKRVLEELSGLNLHAMDPVPLDTDTALIISAKNPEMLTPLLPDPKKRLAFTIREMGFSATSLISTDIVHVPDWAGMKCRFGCEKYGSTHCPPGSLEPHKTRSLLKDYSQAFLLEGEPPTRQFQQRVVQVEREAFKAGFYKALAFWAGPCSLCDDCPEDGKCLNQSNSRPSMEGAGIDVFETVRRAGFKLRTLKSKSDFIKYYALILLE